MRNYNSALQAAFSGLALRGPASQVRAARRFIAGAQGPSVPGQRMMGRAQPAPVAGALGGMPFGPSPVDTGGPVLSDVTNQLTTGDPTIQMAPPNVFCAYTAQPPLYVVSTGTLNDFYVPLFAAPVYFGRVAQLCASAIPIFSAATIGGNTTTCGTTQIIRTSATSQTVLITPAPGCEVFTPGLMIGIAFSQNVTPGNVSITAAGTGQDGCPFTMGPIVVSLDALGQGNLGLLFGCVEQQRLYPVIARLRQDVVQIPAGTTFPGLAAPNTLTSDLDFPNENITITVDGPTGTGITIQTLTWNMPAMSYLANKPEHAIAAMYGCA